AGSYIGLSSGRCTSVVLPAQYTASRSSSPTASSASTYAVIEPVGTSMPAPRNTRANATGTAVTAGIRRESRQLHAHALGTGAGVAQKRVEAHGADALLVLAVLHHGAERGVHRRGIALADADAGRR